MIAESPTSPRVAAQRAGQPHADAGHALGAEPGLAEQLLDQPAGELDALRRRVVDVERLALLGQHRVAEVGDRHAHVRVPEVDPDRHAGDAAERELGAAPALAGEPAVAAQLRAPGWTPWPGESPLRAGQLGLGHRPVPAQEAHHEVAVGGAEPPGEPEVIIRELERVCQSRRP